MRDKSKKIKDFWEANPCGETLVDEDFSTRQGSVADFFDSYDRYRYEKEGHILDCLDQLDCRDKSVLEIGLGQGADSEQLIRRGARWSGIDITEESVKRVATRLDHRNLPYKQLLQGTATSLPFDDSTFDLVYSFGVLHHIPDISQAQREIARVLKPSGQLCIMLYAKN